MENTPQQQTETTFSTDTNVILGSEIPSPRQPRKKRLLLIIGIVVGLGLLVGCAVWLLGGKDTKLGQRQAPVFTDWLKPASEIKIGSYRYVSTCQALTFRDAETAFGTLSDDSYVTEEYIEASPVLKRVETFEGFCSYGDVELYSEQFVDMRAVKRVSSSSYSLGNDSEEIDKKMKVIERVGKNTSDSRVKQFVEKLKSSVATFKEYEKYTSGNELDARQTDGLVLPTGSGGFGLNIYHGNVVYRLEHPLTDDADKDLALSDVEIAKELAKLGKATDILLSNVRNEQLSQSPAPTVLGATNKNGESYILEPCAILTSAVFKQITGTDQNEPIQRHTAYKNVTKERVASGDNIPQFPRNECERSSTQGLGGFSSSSDISVRLQLRYAPSTAALDDMLKKGDYIPLGSGDVVLQTSADWATEYKTSSAPFYRLRVGTYLGTVSIDTVSSEGLGGDITQGQGTREQHVAAINAIVDSLKANVALAARDK